MVSYAESIGLTNANEPTYAHMTSIMFTAHSMHRDCFEVDTSAALKCTKSLKEQIRMVAKRARMEHHGKVIVYPQCIEDFKSQYPDIYARAFNDDDTQRSYSPCPFGKQKIDLMRSQLPMRVTHGSMMGSVKSKNTMRGVQPSASGNLYLADGTAMPLVSVSQPCMDMRHVQPMMQPMQGMRHVQPIVQPMQLEDMPVQLSFGRDASMQPLALMDSVPTETGTAPIQTNPAEHAPGLAGGPSAPAGQTAEKPAPQLLITPKSVENISAEILGHIGAKGLLLFEFHNAKCKTAEDQTNKIHNLIDWYAKQMCMFFSSHFTQNYFPLHACGLSWLEQSV